MKYSEESILLTSQINKIDKKKNGIFFTPPSIINTNLQLLIPFLKKIKNVLEPSCGSGEYIDKLINKNKKLKITGIENNNTIFDAIKDKYTTDNNIQLICDDFLKWNTTQKYDLIIGNPPYFVMNKQNVSSDFYDFFDGRPNIFILFILKSLELLETNGVLSFILPLNFINCLYYDKTRKLINENYNIIDIVYCDNHDDEFIDTKQETIIMIIQNKPPIDNSGFVMNINNYTIFGSKDKITHLQNLYKNSTSLHKLEFEAKVGNIVWNQHKNILTDDNTKTRLIYTNNIENNEFVDKDFNSESKKKYINKSGSHEPLLLINRGYGVGNYHFNYCVFNPTFEYLIENHLIIVKYKHDELPKEELLELYNKIVLSFKDEKTTEFIKTYFGNNAINTTELLHILPIYNF